MSGLKILFVEYQETEVNERLQGFDTEESSQPQGLLCAQKESPTQQDEYWLNMRLPVS
jgi:hypothetical protein